MTYRQSLIPKGDYGTVFTFVFCIILVYLAQDFVCRTKSVTGKSSEHFISLTQNPSSVDFRDIFSVLTSNIISKSPTSLPNLIGFTNKTNITATETTRLPTLDFIIDDILKKINTTKLPKATRTLSEKATRTLSEKSRPLTPDIKWKLLELIKFDVKPSGKQSTYFIELFLTYSDTPVQLVVILDYNEYTKQIHYNKVILLNKIKEFKNAYDPFFDDSFKIENSLGLLPPFKSSQTTIL
jgi:hypothetical protein